MLCVPVAKNWPQNTATCYFNTLWIKQPHKQGKFCIAPLLALRLKQLFRWFFCANAMALWKILTFHGGH